ncbi:transcriptional regulator [Xanthomonas campestris]|uniref:IclR family transcriptional regulator n=1 Tax=Xanthomonas TaxID=338 RepID=UPI000E1F0A47|nr:MULTISPECIES: IclR family transcriptional regulator [Xanthomonas]MEB1549299.1 IclR family transcriptional regulator [Xanthomonas campestris pv. campestris]MEB1553885.1 IclR family transcriptional regulator [Xanthomonas campestris pv. campestris]RJU09175.1 transcriptional regulator [Xanthomonas campestris]
MSIEPAKYRAPALDKGLDILELLARQAQPMSMGAISQGIGRSRGEIFRMLQVLEERGYLTRDGEGDYVLTNRLFMLGMQQPQVQTITDAALPVMRRLADAIFQPCHLVAPSGDQIVVIAQMDVPSDLGLVVRPGHRRPLAHSTSGLVLFAFQQPEVQTRWLEQLDASEVPYDRAQFLRDAEQTRQAGYAMHASEAVVGVVDLTAPILQRGSAAYTLTVPFIERRPELVGPQAALSALRAATAEISAGLH